MRKKIKISLILSLAIIFGCFSNVFAASNQNNKINKIDEVKKSVRLLDNQTQIQPIHRYTFDNDNGNTVVDTGTMAGKDGKYNGTINGTKVINEDGKNYIKFNGGSDSVSFSDPIIPLGKSSIKFKVRFTGAQNANLLSNLYDGHFQNGIAIWVGKTILVGKDFGSQDLETRLYSTKQVNDGQWHTILFECDGTTNDNGVKLYVDDLTIPEAVGKLKHEDTLNAKQNLLIGKYPLNNSYSFVGDLDDLEIYNDVLTDNVNCEKLMLNKTTDSLNVGQADTLIATVTPDNATNKTVNWTSSDPTIVSVDANGKITALKAGTATITATTTDGTNLSKSCVVTVTEPVTPIPTPTAGNRATLTINMVNGSSKQYDLSEDELNSFLNWYNGMTNPLSAQCYTFNNPITGPYLNNKDYIPFNKIDDFKVQEYTK